MPHSCWLVSLFCTVGSPAEPSPVDCCRQLISLTLKCYDCDLTLTPNPAPSYSGLPTPSCLRFLYRYYNQYYLGAPPNPPTHPHLFFLFATRLFQSAVNTVYEYDFTSYLLLVMRLLLFFILSSVDTEKQWPPCCFMQCTLPNLCFMALS